MNDEKKFKDQISEFPCTFHLDFKHVRKIRLKERQKKLEMELNNSSPEIRKLNLLMLLYYKLDKSKKALELSENTPSTTLNIISIANKAYILWSIGDEFGAFENVEKLIQLKSNEMFEGLKLEAKAEMAYTCKKIGGPLNLCRAITLYTEYLAINSQDMDMTLELGITYRRTTHPRIAKSEFFKNDALVNRVKKAADLFFLVAIKDNNGINQARAYAELAVMRSHIQAYITFNLCHPIFRSMSSRQLCLKALKLGENDYRVLCECGRILHRFNWNHAIEVLEQSAAMMPHTVTFHHLALAYGKRARRLQTENKGIRWKSIDTEPKTFLLDFEAEDVQNAIRYFEESVNISLDDNIQALIHYGQFLKSCGKLKEAIVKFNKVIRLITNSMPDKDPSSCEHDQQANIVLAYEQIGLCYLAWYKYATGRSCKSSLFDFKNQTEHGDELSDSDIMDDSQTEPLNEEDTCLDLKVSSDKIKELKDHAESTFMQAISLAARYFNKSPHTYSINVWKSYLYIEQKYKQDECKGLRDLFKLLEVCCYHDKVFQLTEDLKSHDEEQLKQTEVFKCALKSYIALEKYEVALAFLTLLLPHVEIDEGDRLKLEIKVNLLAAASRLQHQEENIIDLFQHVLDLNFQASTVDYVLQEQSSEQHSTVENQVDYLDVLILYNEHCPEDGQPSKSETVARELKKFLKEKFKLRVKCNKERKPCGLRIDAKEMLLYRAIVVIIEANTPLKCFDTGVFEAMLEYLPAIKIHCKEKGRPTPQMTLALPSRADDAGIPEGINMFILKHMAKCYLDETLSTDVTSRDTTLPNETDLPSDGLSPVRNYVPFYKTNPLQGIEAGSNHPRFSPSVTVLMKFFCVLLGREWPSCERTEKEV